MPTALDKTALTVARTLQCAPQPIEVSLEHGWAALVTLQRLAAGELDALLISGPLADDRIRSRTVAHVVPALYVAAEHRLAAQASTTLAQAIDQPTFRRPEDVDPAWRDTWLLSVPRGEGPRYSAGPAVDDLDAQRVIGCGRATGVAPTSWCRQPGITALPILDATPVPVQLVTRNEEPSSALEMFANEIQDACSDLCRGPLTAAEQRVVDLLAGGDTNQEIAQRLHLSVRTVESHISSSLRRTGSRSRTHLVAWWWQGLSGSGAPNR